MIKRVVFLLVTVGILLTFTSCSSEPSLLSYCEMRMPLGEGFYQTEDENFDVVYSNGKYLIAVLRISFVAAVSEGIAETMTPYEFGEFWIEKCQRDANLINDGAVYCEYYGNSEDKEQFYLEAFYRSQYAYFVVLFASDSEAEDVGRVEFLNYAESIYFTD